MSWMKRFSNLKNSLWVPIVSVWLPLISVKSSVTSRMSWLSEFAPDERSVPATSWYALVPVQYELGVPQT